MFPSLQRVPDAPLVAVTGKNGTFKSRWIGERSLVRKGWEWRMRTCCGRLSTRLGVYTEPRTTDVHESDERRCLLSDIYSRGGRRARMMLKS